MVSSRRAGQEAPTVFSRGVVHIINAQKCKEWYANWTEGRDRHKERIAARKYFNH